MKPSKISAFCVITAFLPAVHSASGQVIPATMQTVSSRVVATRSAPAGRPVVNTPMAPHFAPRVATINPRIGNPSARYIVGQPSTVPQHAYSVPMRPSTANFGAVDGQRGTPVRQAITIDPATRQIELRTLATMRIQHALGPRQPNTLNPATRQTELRTLSAMRERQGLVTQNGTLATVNPLRHDTTENPATAPQSQRHESLKDTPGRKWHQKKDNISYDEAFRRHWHEWHDQNWWHGHCNTIVLVATGYYFLDGSYWYPAWGYDPLQSYSDYDGPIYTYGDLLPDEMIANVQTALQDAGYYYGQITGSLGVDTRAAIANFQRDNGLPITGAIDEPTVEALGLYDSGSADNFQTDQGY